MLEQCEEPCELVGKEVARAVVQRGTVLCVAKIRPGGHSYYLEVVETGVEAPGEWLSSGAGLLGLSGTVGPDDLAAVLGGADPTNGRGLRGSHHAVKVAGFDLTFCAPKSVSILHALGAPEVAAEVRSGHSKAVREALGYVERHALAVRRGTGSDRALLDVEGVAAGGFVHRTSRALDPHLHSHVVLANLGRAPDGTWSALDGRGVYAHKAAAGALYHVQLRYELTERLGVGWEPATKGRADIAGIGPEVRRAFSQRAVAIEAHLAERGIQVGPEMVQSRAREVAAFVTRAPRDPHLAPETLRGSWEERAREAGLSPSRLEAVLDREPRHFERRQDRGMDRGERHFEHNEDRGMDRELSHTGGGEARSTRTKSRDGEVQPGKGLEQAVEGLLVDRGRSVTRRDALRAWCTVLETGANVSDVERATDRLLSKLDPVEGWAGARDVPGVGERRHSLEGRAIERAGAAERAVDAERHRMDRHLASRGMSRADDRSLGLGRDSGVDLGW